MDIAASKEEVEAEVVRLVCDSLMEKKAEVERLRAENALVACHD